MVILKVLIPNKALKLSNDKHVHKLDEWYLSNSRYYKQPTIFVLY